jgi:hypothetical protein
MIFFGVVIPFAVALWLSERENLKDHERYDLDGDNWKILLHIRQDVRLAVYLLAALCVVVSGILVAKFL